MGTIKRFENPAQLIRHIADETDTSEDELWNEYKRQINNNE